MDWPPSFAGAPQIVVGSIGRNPAASGVDAASSSPIWHVANTAIFVPFRVYDPLIVTQLVWANGTTLSGNVDCGIYDEVGTRLVSTGSTAQAGSTLLQLVDITDTLLGPGLFYMGLAIDNITATINCIAVGLEKLRMCGLVEMATAFPLPATATFATLTGNIYPFSGGTTRTVV